MIVTMAVSAQIKVSSVDANPALFRCLTELLVLDILSSQDACSQLPRDGVQFLNVLVFSFQFEDQTSKITPALKG